jgi:hypothetical protein
MGKGDNQKKDVKSKPKSKDERKKAKQDKKAKK